jgi:nicotinamidase/pyrazinamidase
MPEYLSDAFDGYESFFVYNKGEHRDKEEYSIFQNEMCGKVLTQQLQHFQNQDEDTYVDVCGIAGDYCVLETIKGLKDIINPEHISVLMDLVASIDGGEKLTEFLDNNGINYFNIGYKES